MAIIKGAIQMTGSIKGMSFYTNAGSDQVIMRTKGGPSARRMKVGNEFAKIRKHQAEWPGCVKFSRGIRYALGENYRLADYNVSPVWCGMGKNLITLDKEHPVGERQLLLSKYRNVLENFSLNRNYPFNTVLRINPQFDINKNTLLATVSIPQLNTEMDLLNIQKLPYFRVIVSLGVVSDLAYSPDNKNNPYEPALKEFNGCSGSTISDWFSTDDLIGEQTMTVKLADEIVERMTDDTTALLGIGVEFGKVGFAGQTTPVKRAGCAKVLKVC